VLLALDAAEPRDADALAAATGLSAARLSAALVLLELEGLAEALPGALFARRRARA
jgi:predicted Rossmann fold nucleotide-binding protein DprA/Smf involved in DNA uptake